MAIAKVRIAPVERWCEVMLRGAKRHKVAELLNGIIVEIETKSLGSMLLPNPCGGKWWALSGQSKRELAQLTTLPISVNADVFVCEHMLEMD